MAKIKQANKKKGVTLIEAIIGVALLSILMIPISGLITNAVKNGKNGEIRQKASYVGRKIIEEMEAYSEILDPIDTSSFKLLDGGILVNTATDQYTLTDDPSTAKNDCIRTIDGEVKGPEYEIRLTLEKDTSFRYLGTDNKTLHDDADQKINISQIGTQVRLSVENFAGTENVGNNIALKIKDPMTIGLWNKDTNTLIKEYVKPSINNKIRIYLEDTFESNLDVDVENFKGQNVDIYVVKSNLSTGIIDINPKKGNITRYNLNENEATRVGELYKLNVQVLEKDKPEVLFEGNSSTNINIE